MALSGRFMLALLAGLSVSILLAGYFLNKRRRRYRAVSTFPSVRDQTSSLQRSFTFQSESTSLPYDGDTPDDLHYKLSQEHLLASQTSLNSLDNSDNDFVEATDLPMLPTLQIVRPVSPSGSDHSSESFHSTLNELPPLPLIPSSNELYHTGLYYASQGQVLARTLRTEELGCSGDIDFLAKLYCVRLAFDELTLSQANREYFHNIGRDLMSSFLSSAGHDTSLFCERFDNLVAVMTNEEGRRLAELELTERRVVAMNVYDIALDFILLDAFSDLNNPPSTVLAVLQNTWITDGMKKSALSAAVWSLLKAKRSMLTNKDGFMGQFYLLSEVLTPVMAWGFLGTDLTMKQNCHQLKGTIIQFLQGVFSLETVRYSSINCLANDIIILAERTVDKMTSNL